VGVDCREVQFSGDEEENRFHGLEAGVTARFSFCRLEQPVEGFDEAAGLAGPRPVRALSKNEKLKL
jgi:hypothetical protein